MIRRIIVGLLSPSYRKWRWGITAVVGITAVYWLINNFQTLFSPRNAQFLQWFRGDEATRQALVTVQKEACSGAPFILPSEGFIGLLYDDPRGPYSQWKPHQGIDIFSSGAAGEAPVYAAYDGYITREANWKSAVIQRIPSDPLQPGRQIWLYYAHMADRAGNSFIEPAFAAGTADLFVPQGTLLGYTGNYNGNSLRTIAVHLHFSIVLDDGSGSYRNELEFSNTVDPSPYLGMPVRYSCDTGTTGCATAVTCQE